MKRLKWPLLLGLVSYLIAMIWTLPAQLFVDHALPRVMSGNQQVDNVAGTLFNGSADLHVTNQLLGRLDWQVKPLYLLVGKIAAQLAISNSTDKINGEVSIGFGPSITLSEIIGNISVAQLFGLLPLPNLNLTPAGELLVQIDQVDLAADQAGWLPTHAQGEVLWKGAVINAPEPVQLGELRLDLETSDGGGVQAVLKDEGGPLRAHGNLTLNLDRQYSVDLTLGVRGGEQAKLKQLLSMLGRTNEQGMTRLLLKGRLK